MQTLDKDEIVRLTGSYGGAWGLNHTRRLLHLVERIGKGLDYDAGVVWLAAHLHDWGAYPAWSQPGVDHALRSRQVAGEFLLDKGLPGEQVEKILECIATHHSGDPQRSLEAILLSDADALDFLGVVGILRDFSKAPKDLRKAYDTVQARRRRIPAQLCLESSRELAGPRLAEMDQFLAAFEAESFGCF